GPGRAAGRGGDPGRRRVHGAAVHERRPGAGAEAGGRRLCGGHAARVADRVRARHPQPAQLRADRGAGGRAGDPGRGRGHGLRRGPGDGAGVRGGDAGLGGDPGAGAGADGRRDAVRGGRGAAGPAGGADPAAALRAGVVPGGGQGGAGPGAARVLTARPARRHGPRAASRALRHRSAAVPPRSGANRAGLWAAARRLTCVDTTLQDPLVGQVLDGRYRVEARIAVGGMATVYRAVDTRLDRVLALKVMHPALAADASFVERFIREAKSVARLAHPNVVQVFDQGTDGAYVYLAMEYIAGCTLRDVLRERGALQPRAALDILEPVLAALGAAHRAGFVHRDMKPENVLIGD